MKGLAKKCAATSSLGRGHIPALLPCGPSSLCMQHSRNTAGLFSPSQNSWKRHHSKGRQSRGGGMWNYPCAGCRLRVPSVIENAHTKKEFKKKHGQLVFSSFSSFEFSTANMLIHIILPHGKKKSNRKCHLKKISPRCSRVAAPASLRREKVYVRSII